MLLSLHVTHSGAAASRASSCMDRGQRLLSSGRQVRLPPSASAAALQAMFATGVYDRLLEGEARPDA
jgi:hypothetical protein